MADRKTELGISSILLSNLTKKINALSLFSKSAVPPQFWLAHDVDILNIRALCESICEISRCAVTSTSFFEHLGRETDFLDPAQFLGVEGCVNSLMSADKLLKSTMSKCL